MLNLLKSERNNSGIHNSNAAELANDGHNQFQADIIALIKDLSAGRSPDLSCVPDNLAQPIGELADRLQKRDAEDLTVTVEFSINASESMAAVARITGDVRDISSETQMMASAIEQLDASVNQLAETAQYSSSEMQEASNFVAKGTKNVHDATEATRQTSEAMTTMATEAKHVTEAVEQIETFISTIDGIAQQTNLLALNATIEAARAGEAGKGFAVVASEVKTLSGQTQKATEDISALIGRLQAVVGKLLASVEVARSSVDTAQELAANTEKDISAVNEIVVKNSERMNSVASVLSEQSSATKELSHGVFQIAQKSNVAAEQSDLVVKAVHSSEALIDRKFAQLDNCEIKDYVLHRAKSDHFLWKKRLSEMVVGFNALKENELADHNSCRLGKWYNAVADQTITSHPAFLSLEEPHAAVHSHGKHAASLFASGNRDGAYEEISKMEKASVEVVALLDKLINR